MRIDPQPVLSAADPRILEYAQLTDMELRQRSEPAAGIFIAEGHLVIARSVDSGLTVRSVLTSPRWIERLRPVLVGVDAPVYLADEQVMREITGFHVHRGALASVDRPAALATQEVLGMGGDVLLLEDLVDPTNVGLAVRSAAVQGVASVVLSPRCADPLYRRAVKSSMGAVLRVAWSRSDDWARTLAEAAHGRAVIALAPDADDDLDSALRRAKGSAVGLVLGSEGPGLAPETRSADVILARIPMSNPGDSLNVAAAAAVACYALARSRTS